MLDGSQVGIGHKKFDLRNGSQAKAYGRCTFLSRRICMKHTKQQGLLLVRYTLKRRKRRLRTLHLPFLPALHETSTDSTSTGTVRITHYIYMRKNPILTPAMHDINSICSGAFRQDCFRSAMRTSTKYDTVGRSQNRIRDSALDAD